MAKVNREDAEPRNWTNKRYPDHWSWTRASYELLYHDCMKGNVAAVVTQRDNLLKIVAERHGLIAQVNVKPCNAALKSYYSRYDAEPTPIVELLGHVRFNHIQRLAAELTK